MLEPFLIYGAMWSEKRSTLIFRNCLPASESDPITTNLNLRSPGENHWP